MRWAIPECRDLKVQYHQALDVEVYPMVEDLTIHIMTRDTALVVALRAVDLEVVDLLQVCPVRID